MWHSPVSVPPSPPCSMLAVVLTSCTSTAVSPAGANIEFGGEGGCSLIVSLYRLISKFGPPFASPPSNSAGKDFCKTTARMICNATASMSVRQAADEVAQKSSGLHCETRAPVINAGRGRWSRARVGREPWSRAQVVGASRGHGSQSRVASRWSQLLPCSRQPTRQPIRQPTKQPTRQPTRRPTR